MTTTPPMPDAGVPRGDPAAVPRESPRGVAVAWVVIVLCVGFVFARTTWHYHHSVAGQSGDASVSGLTLKINARIALGARAVAARAGAAGAGFNADAQAAPFEQVVADTGAAPDDRLRAVMVLGELLGAAEASARLDRVAPNLDSPELNDDVRLLRTIYRDGPDALSAAEAKRLIERHGWFARLALATGRPAGDPVRVVADAPAVRAFVGAAVALLAGAVALIAGVILLVLGLVQYADGRLPLAYAPPAAPPDDTGPFLEGFAVYLAGIIALSFALGRLWPHPPVWANLLLGIAALLAIGWIRLRGITGDRLRRALGWHAGRGVFREVGAGFVGYLATLPLMALGLIATLLLQRLSHVTPNHPAQQMIEGPPGQILQLYLLAAVFAPITEELMFRGAFYHRLRRRLAWPLAALACGLVFALIHPQGWVGAPPLIALGFAFACLREWRGSLLAPMTAHACNNFVTVTLLAVLAS